MPGSSRSSTLPTAGTTAEKSSRFESLKARYREQLRDARRHETGTTDTKPTRTTESAKTAKAVTPSTSPSSRSAASKRPVATTKPAHRDAVTAVHSGDPVAVAAFGSSTSLAVALPREESMRDEGASSISVSPLTTPGASYSMRLRPPPPPPLSPLPTAQAPASHPAAHAGKSSVTTDSAVGAHGAASPPSSYATLSTEAPRPSFATDFANLYEREPVRAEQQPSGATRSAHSAEPSARPRPAKTVATPTVTQHDGPQLRMRQRPLGGTGSQDTSSPTSAKATESPQPSGGSRPKSKLSTADSNSSNSNRLPAAAAAATSTKPRTTRRISTEGTQLEQMEAVMDYLESTTQALAQRTKSLPPPESLVAFRASITPATRHASNAPEATVEAHFSLLSQLHETSSALLSWFSKLEYPRLPEETTLEEVEQHTMQTCRELAALVEKLDRKFSTHESTLVREAYAERHRAVLAHRQLIDAVERAAQHIVVLRRLVYARDLPQARQVLAVHQTEVQDSVAAATIPSHVTAMLNGPYFTWLEQRWLPAMTAWRRITHTALQEARTTQQYRTAIANAQRDALTVVNLHEVLRANETVSDLHRIDIVTPIEALANDSAEVEAAVRELEAAMMTPTLTELAKAIRHLQGCLGDGSSLPSTEVSPSHHSDEQSPPLRSPVSASDGVAPAAAHTDARALIKQAQQLLVQVQQSASTLRAMQTAVQAPRSARSLFQVVHRANELLYVLNLGVDPQQVQSLVRQCRPIAQRVCEWRGQQRSPASTSHGVDVVECDKGSGYGSASPWRSSSRTSPSPRPHADGAEPAPAGSGGFPLADLLAQYGLTPDDICLPHTPSVVWTDACVEAYQTLCAAFVRAYACEDVQAKLESDLRNGQPAEDGSLSVSPTSTVAGSGFSVDSLRTHLRDAEALGLSGVLLDQARARLAQSQGLRVKVHFQAHTRLLQLAEPTTASFEDVYRQLYAFCAEQALSSQYAVPDGQELRIRYEDSEGDYISILSEADWALMRAEVLAHDPTPGTRGRKVDLFCDFPARLSSDPAAVRHHAANGVADPPSSAQVARPAPTVPHNGASEGNKHTPGTTRSAALRLAAARSRSAGVRPVTHSAAFAPRSRSGAGRTAEGMRGKQDTAKAEAGARAAARRPASRRTAHTEPTRTSEPACTPPVTDSPQGVVEEPPRATVHKNILQGAKTWQELRPATDPEGDDVLELMTTATTTTPSATVPQRRAKETALPPGGVSSSPPRATPDPPQKRRVAALSTASLTLPPRPQPSSHAATPAQKQAPPHRRLSRRGSQAESSVAGADAPHRTTDALMAEVERLQVENEVAMLKRATPRDD